MCEKLSNSRGQCRCRCGKQDKFQVHGRGSLHIGTEKNRPFLNAGEGSVAAVVLGQELINELVNVCQREF